MPPKKKTTTKKKKPKRNTNSDLALGIAIKQQRIPSMQRSLPKIAKYVNNVGKLDDYALGLTLLKDTGNADLYESKVRAFLGPNDISNLLQTRNSEIDRALHLTNFNQTQQRVAFGALNGLHSAHNELLMRKAWGVPGARLDRLAHPDHRSTVQSLTSGSSSYGHLRSDPRRSAIDKYLQGASREQYTDLQSALMGHPNAGDLFVYASEYDYEEPRSITAGDAEEFVLKLLEKKTE